MGTVTGSVHGAGCEWLQYDYDSGLIPRDRPVSFTMWRYRALLPVPDEPVRYPVPIGGTPLLSAPALRRRSGTPHLWIKDETRGPTASNKDRATALVIEDGLRRGSTRSPQPPPGTRRSPPPSVQRRRGSVPRSSCPPTASPRSSRS